MNKVYRMVQSKEARKKDSLSWSYFKTMIKQTIQINFFDPANKTEHNKDNLIIIIIHHDF